MLELFLILYFTAAAIAAVGAYVATKDEPYITLREAMFVAFLCLTPLLNFWAASVVIWDWAEDKVIYRRKK